jgi:NAD(P)-dependent dehydrogenase (short-subunit alcohol dehydrogenase family)
MDVKGKVALVTGGSSGIDKATAFAFARAGATVVVASRRIAEGEETVHEICDRGGDAIFVPTDVSKDNDVRSLIDKTLDMFGNLDSAFNNAGGWIMGSLTEQSEEDWDRIMDMNLKGTWLCLKYETLDTVSPDMLVQNAALHPIRRIGQPEEIAEAVVWLCSDEASFLTGHNTVIDGGYTAQ